MKDKLKSIELRNFKGFKKHSITLRNSNIFVGANNSGKSTALAAIRLVSHMLPDARRQHPRKPVVIDGVRVLGWPVTATALENAAFSTDNLKFDFSPLETRITVTTSSGTKIILVWPEALDDEDESVGIMAILPGAVLAGSEPRDVARNNMPDISVIPRLTPLDDQESFVADDTFKKRIRSGRSSRYFRNALSRIDGESLNDFLLYMTSHTPEVGGLEVTKTPTIKSTELDLYYIEGETKREREIAWAGDGIQIWLQLMYHLWAGRKSDVVVMDEPDVFLHPDLQRRIARIVSAHSSQTIIATHSIEIIAEASPGSTVWIDRNRRSAERSKGNGALESAGRRLGSGFDLGIGRALRSRVVVFVEGQDSPILAHLARELGLHAFAASDNYATVPMGGSTRHDLATSFGEVMKILGSAPKIFVILDSDLHSPSIIEEMERNLTHGNSNVEVIIWRRRELENYLLNAPAISRISGIDLVDARRLLESTIDELKDEALNTFTATVFEDQSKPGSTTRHHSPKTLLMHGNEQFAKKWNIVSERINLIDPKVAISRINQELQKIKAKTINADKLARNTPKESIPNELIDALTRINESILLS